MPCEEVGRHLWLEHTYLWYTRTGEKGRLKDGWYAGMNFSQLHSYFFSFFFSIDGAAAASKVRVLYGREQREWRVEVGVLLMGLLWVRPGMWWGEVHVGVGD